MGIQVIQTQIEFQQDIRRDWNLDRDNTINTVIKGVNMKDKKLKREFDYYHNKVEEMEQERETDRSWELQKALKKHKKMKLKLKDQLYKK